MNRLSFFCVDEKEVKTPSSISERCLLIPLLAREVSRALLLPVLTACSGFEKVLLGAASPQEDFARPAWLLFATKEQAVAALKKLDSQKVVRASFVVCLVSSGSSFLRVVLEWEVLASARLP